MCGIAGIHIKDPSKGFAPKVLDNLVDNLLLGIENRGTDATGIVAVTDGGKQVLLRKQDIEASEFVKTRPRLGDMEKIRTVLLHTRFATQGHQSRNENNHPVLYKTCFATHNGHINNDAELFSEFELRRNAEVDSEIIPALFSQFGLDQAHRALQELDGNLAVAVIDPVQFPDKLILAKGWGSPLIFFENSQFIVWASTLQAIRDAWGKSLGTPPQPKKFWELQEGALMLVEGDKSELLEYKPKERVRWSSSSWGSQSWGSKTTYINTSINCENCGCTKFWHAGHQYSGGCLAKPKEMQGGMCRCMGFVAPKEATEDNEDAMKDLVTCDSCYDEFPLFIMEEVWGEYWMCEGCLYSNQVIDDNGLIVSKECEHKVCGRTCNIGPTVGNQLALVSSRECTHVSCDSICLLGGDLTCGIRAFADEVIEPGIWTPKDELMTNDERHNTILTALSSEHNHPATFIEWLLFKSPLEAVDNNPWLGELRDRLDTGYADKEEELNELEAQIYAESMVTA